MANKAEMAKQKTSPVESDQASEDKGQVPNPELYIALNPEVYKNSNWREEKDPEQKKTGTQQSIVIKEDVNSNIDPCWEESSSLTKEREDNVWEEEAQKFPASGTVKW